MTSHDVVSWLRRKLGIKGIGHSGTLDPMATGVLNAFVGQSTKLIALIDHPYKRYRMTMQLGMTSDTLDIWGKVETHIENPEIDLDRLKGILKTFTGQITQVPPMYSAIKVNGRRLYDLARKGEYVERKERLVDIQSIEMINIVEHSIICDVICSKGTYIRSLISDIGESYGTGAVMTDLIRLENEGVSINEALTLEEINQKITTEDFSFIVPPMTIMKNFGQRFGLSTQEYTRLKHGAAIKLPEHLDQVLLVYNEALVGLAEVKMGHTRVIKRFLNGV
jgi:tRNA pseudouridine55 synthase